MDYKEVEKWVIRAKEGSQEDVQKLLNHYKGYIYKTAGEFYLKNYEVEDFMQVGYLAVIKAISKYVPGTNTFCSYVMRVIRNAVLYQVRHRSKEGYEVSLNNQVRAEEEGLEFIDILPAEKTLEDEVVAAETYENLRAALEELSEAEKDLVYKLYYDKMKLATYARELGITYNAARRKKARVLGKLRRELL
ncbi:sigma-70 family RNA polymerase sigma factor [Clostridium thermarum]|uniref:sigma-70 family RNA polymerase sigma factor n=1 Tax=Clostridium thermarum TaxID=1716543 RepID=UPI0011204444|nr:sigma-70 family RNA polymerase sigma factor [Clostridium thermarum]